MTIRLGEELEAVLDDLAGREKVSRSELIRRSINHYIKQRFVSRSAFELGKDFFGLVGSNNGRLSQDYKSLLKEKIKSKQKAR